MLSSVPGGANARTLEIYPSIADTDEEFERVANTLAPGDTLILHGGTYSQTARRAVTCNGTPAAPIVIRAADGQRPILTRPPETMDTQNNIELVSCSYFVVKGLGFEGGSTGVRFVGGHHVTVEDCEISGTGNNGIALNSGNSDSLIIRRNEIHHTGQSVSGTTEGEGLYVGCNNNSCRVTHSVIEGNYIHNLRGTSAGGNDGIEVKVGSYGNLIRDNVIHDTNIGTSFPGIFVYGGGSEVNVVEGNVIWNAGEAIQVVSDAIVRNNLILTSSITGITAAPHSQVAVMRNVTIVNNTIYGQPEGIYVRWSTATNMVLANNAVYCPTGVAVDASGLSGGAATVAANYVEGALQGVSLDGVGFISGGSSGLAFQDPQSRNFWPAAGSPLLGTARPEHVPTLDFNGTVRTAPYDVGAYETEGLASNPGWPVGPGFKNLGGQRDLVPPSAPLGLRAR